MSKLENYSHMVIRYGIAIILLWFGIFKFTPTEAEAIQDLIENSPFMSWLYDLGSVQSVSNLIGVIEIIAAIGMSLNPVNSRIALVGDSLAILTFLATLSFLFTTPGMFNVVDGMFVPAGGGGFIIKDLVLLGGSLSSFHRDYQLYTENREI